jgi:hypothetical protein
MKSIFSLMGVLVIIAAVTTCLVMIGKQYQMKQELATVLKNYNSGREFVETHRYGERWAVTPPWKEKEEVKIAQYGTRIWMYSGAVAGVGILFLMIGSEISKSREVKEARS